MCLLVGRPQSFKFCLCCASRLSTCYVALKFQRQFTSSQSKEPRRQLTKSPLTRSKTFRPRCFWPKRPGSVSIPILCRSRKLCVLLFPIACDDRSCSDFANYARVRTGCNSSGVRLCLCLHLLLKRGPRQIPARQLKLYATSCVSDAAPAQLQLVFPVANAR